MKGVIMARKPSPPGYCHHKTSNRAYTRVNGKQIYLGDYDSKESRTKYAEIVADWSAGNLDKYGESVSIARLSVAYLKHAEKYYVKNGEVTSNVHRAKSALRTLVSEYGKLQADQFKPMNLEKLQEKFIELNLSRRTITTYIDIIRQAFRFGVTKGKVHVAVWQSLLAVRHLQKGRTEAKEPKGVKPVHPFDIIKTLRELGPVVKRMVRLQLITGMRPGEVRSMRLCDIDRSKDVWVYSPESHKTQHHGRSRLILLGRKAQRILRPLLNRSEESYLFSPEELTQVVGVAGKLHYVQQYDWRSYYRTIARASKRAGIDCWGPNRLRHNYATRVRKRFGLEAAQILLGHSKADVTQIYAERDMQKAEDVVREVG